MLLVHLTCSNPFIDGVFFNRMIHQGVQKASHHHAPAAGVTEGQLLRSKCPRVVPFPPKHDRGAELVLSP